MLSSCLRFVESNLNLNNYNPQHQSPPECYTTSSWASWGTVLSILSQIRYSTRAKFQDCPTFCGRLRI